jgi:hypothetical protein
MGLTNGHKPDCACPLCAGKARTAEREAAEADQAATVRAVARLGAWMAAQLARQGGGSAPDVLRQALGPSDALRVLRMAGQDAGQVAAGWAAAAPVIRQESAQHNSGYAGDPDHDVRVTALLQRGASWAELNAVRAEVRDEYAGRAVQRQRQADVYYGRDQTPEAFPAGPDGLNQRSVVHTGVPELGES